MPLANVPDFHTVLASASKTLLRLLPFIPPTWLGSYAPALTGLRPELKSFAYAGLLVVAGGVAGCAWCGVVVVWLGVDGAEGAGLEGCEAGGPGFALGGAVGAAEAGGGLTADGGGVAGPGVAGGAVAGAWFVGGGVTLAVARFTAAWRPAAARA